MTAASAVIVTRPIASARCASSTALDAISLTSSRDLLIVMMSSCCAVAISKASFICFSSIIMRLSNCWSARAASHPNICVPIVERTIMDGMPSVEQAEAAEASTRPPAGAPA